MSASPKTIVQCVWDSRREKIPDAELTERLAKMGLSSEQIAHVFEMVEFSLNRAFMETLGGSHSADYDSDPFFRASLSLARRDFPASPSVRRERLVVRSAVGAAVMVGLFSIGAVLYYAIDLWRASH
ncbi:MAG: hypothetical protein QM813_06400 [Verrucomicrobiota bacterium]